MGVCIVININFATYHLIMDELLQQVIFNNAILSYLVFLGTLLLVVLFKKYLSKYVAGLFFKLIHRDSWKVEKKDFINLLVGPLNIFLVVLTTIIALDKLTFPNLLKFEVHHISSQRIFESVGSIIIVLVITWLLLRMIDFVALLLEQKANLTPDLTDNQLVVFFKDFFKVVIVFIGFLLLIQFGFKKDIAPLLAGFGIIGAGIALAARESLENLIASFIIFFDKPFHVGDLVKVHQITGTVEKIGLRSTRIRTDQKTYVTVPNKQMVDSILDNLTLRTQRRADLNLNINLSTSATQLQELLTGIKRIVEHPLVENKTVVMNDIATNAYIIHVEYYTGLIAYNDFLELKEMINIEIIKLLEALSIELSGPINNEIKWVNGEV
jgi:MscS family membrane protein